MLSVLLLCHLLPNILVKDNFLRQLIFAGLNSDEEHLIIACSQDYGGLRQCKMATVGAAHIELHIWLLRNLCVMSQRLCPLFILQSVIYILLLKVIDDIISLDFGKVKADKSYSIHHRYCIFVTFVPNRLMPCSDQTRISV